MVNALGNYPSEISDAIFAKSNMLPNNTQLSIAIMTGDKPRYYGIIIEGDELFIDV